MSLVRNRGVEPLTVGSHFFLELYDCPAALLEDRGYVHQVIRDAVERSNSTLISDIAHKFHPQGVTSIALLAESHISIHTWPELGYAAADAFTCGDSAKPEKACRHFVEAFQAKRYLLRRINRGPAFAANAKLTAQPTELATAGSPPYPARSTELTTQNREQNRGTAEEDETCQAPTWAPISGSTST